MQWKRAMQTVAVLGALSVFGAPRALSAGITDRPMKDGSLKELGLQSLGELVLDVNAMKNTTKLYAELQDGTWLEGDLRGQIKNGRMWWTAKVEIDGRAKERKIKAKGGAAWKRSDKADKGDDHEGKDDDDKGDKDDDDDKNDHKNKKHNASTMVWTRGPDACARRRFRRNGSMLGEFGMSAAQLEQSAALNKRASGDNQGQGRFGTILVQSFGEHYLVFVAGYQTPHVRTPENYGELTRPAGMKIEVFVTKNVAMTGALVGSETQVLPALKALVGRIQNK